MAVFALDLLHKTPQSRVSLSLFAELPNSKPQLHTDSDRYEPGDVLLANCSSGPSKPRAELTLTLNNQVVSICSII